jgi:hypothetical protein
MDLDAAVPNVAREAMIAAAEIMRTPSLLCIIS